MSEVALHLQSIIVRSPDQVSGDLDGKTVLLSIQNGNYYNMNEVGTRVWALIEQPIRVAALVDRLVEEFDVSREQCEREVTAFLEQLQRDRLLRIEPGTA